MGRALSPAGDGQSPQLPPPPGHCLNCRRDIPADETGVVTSTCNLPDFYLRRRTLSTCRVFLYLGRTLWSTSVSRRRPAFCRALRSSWSLNSRRSGDRPVCRSRKTLSERSSSSDWVMFSRGRASISLSTVWEREQAAVTAEQTISKYSEAFKNTCSSSTVCPRPATKPFKSTSSCVSVADLRQDYL